MSAGPGPPRLHDAAARGGMLRLARRAVILAMAAVGCAAWASEASAESPSTPGDAVADSDSATAPSVEDLLDRALALYQQAQATEDAASRVALYGDAERLLAELAALRPASAALLLTLGNAALQAEHMGAAILAYRRALARAPDLWTARQNLEYARELLAPWVPRPAPTLHSGSLLGPWTRLSSTERSVSAALACLAAAALAGAGLALRLAWLRNAAAVPAVLWVVLLMLGWLASGEGTADDAVLTVADVQARAADAALAPPLFPGPLPAGTEVRVVERRELWARVRLANGREAWVPASSFTLVGAPSGG